MSTERAQISPGMNVIGADGNAIGQVEEIRVSDFLVGRPDRPDVFVPLAAILDIGDYTIALNVASDQIDQQGWEQPPKTGREAA